jgi:hypothetical protein
VVWPAHEHRSLAAARGIEPSGAGGVDDTFKFAGTSSDAFCGYERHIATDLDSGLIVALYIDCGYIASGLRRAAGVSNLETARRTQRAERPREVA